MVDDSPDVLITTTFTSTPKSVMASYRTCHRAGHVFRIALTVLLVVEGLATFDALPIVLGLALYGGLEYAVRRSLRPYLQREREVTVSMTEDEYRVTGPDRRTSRTWSTFTSVRPTGRFWVLRINWALAMAFPLTALDGEQTKRFEALLRRNGLRS